MSSSEEQRRKDQKRVSVLTVLTAAIWLFVVAVSLSRIAGGVMTLILMILAPIAAAALMWSLWRDGL